MTHLPADFYDECLAHHREVSTAHRGFRDRAERDPDPVLRRRRSLSPVRRPDRDRRPQSVGPRVPDRQAEVRRRPRALGRCGARGDVVRLLRAQPLQWLVPQLRSGPVGGGRVLLPCRLSLPEGAGRRRGHGAASRRLLARRDRPHLVEPRPARSHARAPDSAWQQDLPPPRRSAAARHRHRLGRRPSHDPVPSGLRRPRWMGRHPENSTRRWAESGYRRRCWCAVSSRATPANAAIG